MTAIMIGNSSVRTDRSRVDDYLPGFDLFTTYGWARLTTTAANNWDVFTTSETQTLLTIPGSAGDPSWLAEASASIALGRGQTIAGTNGDVLKLGTSLADVAFVANSAPVAGALLGAQGFRQQGSPGAVTQITANNVFRLFLHNGANAAPAGNLTLIASAIAERSLLIPVSVCYFKRSLPIRLDDVSSIPMYLQRLVKGLT